LEKPDESGVGELLWKECRYGDVKPAVTRLDHPTRLDRARALGFKAKQGIAVARVRIRRGGRRKSRWQRGRRTKHMGVNKITPGKSIQSIGEERVARRFPICRY